MGHYAELAPAPAARGLVDCVWSRRAGAAADTPARIVPDGCVDIVWYRLDDALLVAGPDTRAHLAEPSGGEIVGLRFRTGVASAGLGVPADALRDGRVALAQVWSPGRAGRLTERLAATAGPRQAQAVLTAAVLDGVRAAPDPAAEVLVGLARSGLRVGAMAEVVGLTERQLHRRCLAAFGYSAKVLTRVLRFDAAIRMARRGTGFAEVAHRCGYADQAHLSREVRALAGVPLAGLVRVGAP